jgi:two-component system, sensor histidine kinase and response regulator
MKPTQVSDRVNNDDQQKAQTIVSTPAPALAPSASAKILWGKTEALARLGGDEELLRELCQIFLTESPKHLQELRQAIAQADPEAVRRAAHSLKGELGYLGAGAAEQASRVLEGMGHDKNLSQATEVFASLEREMAGLHFALKDFAGAAR